jgi:hypothetical protein
VEEVGGDSMKQENGCNVSICGAGKRRERRKKKMSDFTNLPIFVGESTPPMNIVHVYSSVMWLHR